VDAPAQHGAGQRRVDADPAARGVGLVRADDAVARGLAGGEVLQLDPRAEEYRLRVRRLPGDHAQRLEPLAQVAHAAVDLPELLLAVGVLGILGAVALGRGRGQGLDHFRALHPPQLVELGLQARVALWRDQRGAFLGWRPPTAHRVLT